MGADVIVACNIAICYRSSLEARRWQGPTNCFANEKANEAEWGGVSNGWKTDKRIEAESVSFRLSVSRSNPFEAGGLFSRVARVTFVSELLRKRMSE